MAGDILIDASHHLFAAADALKADEMVRMGGSQCFAGDIPFAVARHVDMCRLPETPIAACAVGVG